MDVKDNFTNRYFKDGIKNQIDLINQPTQVDAMADAFSSQANRPAQGPAQRNSNALMAGFGAGLKGAANRERQEQLSPVLKMVGEMNARSAYLEAQMQQEQQQKMTVVKFLRDNKSAIMDLGNASVANNPDAQEIAKYLSNRFENATGQTVGTFNSFDTKQRKTFYDQKDGSTIGYGFLDAIEPYAVDAYGEEATDILQNLSPYHNKKYREAEENRSLALEKERAGIRNTNAQANHHDANTRHLSMQDKEIEDRMNAPKAKYDDKTLSHIRTDNSNWVNNLYSKHKDANKAIKAQEQIRDAIQKEINEGSWQTGSSSFAAAARWMNEKSGNAKTKQLIELKRQPLFKDLKNTFGSRITDNDLATWLTTQVDLSTDPDLAIEVLNERINDAKSEINEELTRRKILENEFQNSEPYNSLAIDERLKQDLENQKLIKENDNSDQSNNRAAEQNNKTVTMQNAAGQTFQIPRDMVEAALNDPDEPLTLVK